MDAFKAADALSETAKDVSTSAASILGAECARGTGSESNGNAEEVCGGGGGLRHKAGRSGGGGNGGIGADGNMDCE